MQVQHLHHDTYTMYINIRTLPFQLWRLSALDALPASRSHLLMACPTTRSALHQPYADYGEFRRSRELAMFNTICEQLSTSNAPFVRAGLKGHPTGFILLTPDTSDAANLSTVNTSFVSVPTPRRSDRSLVEVQIVQCLNRNGFRRSPYVEEGFKFVRTDMLCDED